MNWKCTYDYDTARVTCLMNCWKWIKMWKYFEQVCGWIRLWEHDFCSNRMVKLKPVRITLCPGRSMTVMLCNIVDDFYRVLTSQSMLWRHCHIAEFVVWELLAGEVRCRLHSPLKSCVKCWTFQIAWQCVTQRTLKLSVLQYQVSATSSLRLLAVPCFRNWLLKQTVCYKWTCFVHIWSWNLC
jgi:hypothetical protein